MTRTTRTSLLLQALVISAALCAGCGTAESTTGKLFGATFDLSVGKSSSVTITSAQLLATLDANGNNGFGGATSLTLESVILAPANGSLSSLIFEGGMITYTPTPGFVGTDEFKLHAGSGEDGFDITFHVTVNSSIDCKTGTWTNLGAIGDAARGAIEKIRAVATSAMRAAGSGPDDGVIVAGVQHDDVTPATVGPAVNMDLAPGIDPGTGMITRNDAGDFVADDYHPGTRVSISGSGAGNDTFGAIVNVISATANALVVDTDLTTENSSAITLSGMGGAPATFYQVWNSSDGLQLADTHTISPEEALASFEATISDADPSLSSVAFRVLGGGEWIPQSGMSSVTVANLAASQALPTYTGGDIDADVPRVMLPADARPTATRLGFANQTAYAFYQRMSTEPTDPSDLFIRMLDDTTDTFGAATRIFDINPATDTVLIANARFANTAAWALALVNTPGGLQSWIRPYHNGTWGAPHIVAGATAVVASTTGHVMAIRTNPLDNTRVESSWYQPGTDTWTDLTALDYTSAVSFTQYVPTFFDHPVRGLDLPVNHGRFDDSRLIVRCSDGAIRESVFDATAMSWSDSEIYNSSMGAGGAIVSTDVFPERYGNVHLFIQQDDGAGDNQLWHQRYDKAGNTWSTPIRVDDTATSGAGGVQFSNLFGQAPDGSGTLIFSDNNGQTLFGSFYDGMAGTFSTPMALNTDPLVEAKLVGDNKADALVVFKEDNGAGTQRLVSVSGLAGVWQAPVTIKQVAGTIDSWSLDVDMCFRPGPPVPVGSFTAAIALSSGGMHEVWALHD
ncbi:MAG: Ig-like domain-containing protein [Planctomycetota bacterium]